MGGIQNAAVPEGGAPAVNGTDNVAGNGLGLVRLVPVFTYADFLAGPKIAPQVFFKLARIAADDRIGGRQNIARGAIVLLQLDDFKGGPVRFQAGQVFGPRGPPGVD